MDVLVLLLSAFFSPIFCFKHDNLISQSLSSSTDTGSSPQSYEQEGSALLEAISAPLAEDLIVLMGDSGEMVWIILNTILYDLHKTVQQPIFLLTADDHLQEQLPPPSLLSGRCAVVMVISKWPDWLDELGDNWSPNIMLVLNLNTSLGSESLLMIPELQRAPLLVLLESSDKDVPPTVYTSYPLLRDALGKRQFSSLLGQWDRTVFSKQESLFPDRFNSFGGEVLHIASDLDDYPLIFEDGDHLDGTNIRILNALGHWLNFTYTTTVYAEDENWGELVNGSWNGLLGEVHRRTKNLTVNYFTVVYERSRDFDYTSSYFNEGFGFALIIPPPLPAWMRLLYPFSNWLWVSTLCLLLVVTPVLYFLTSAANTPSISFQDASLEVMRGILRQSSPRVFSSDVVRLIMASWWLGGLILVVSYTSNLIAVLTVPVFPPKITTIEELAKSDYRVSMVDYGEFVPEALVTSKDQDLKALGDRMDLIFNYEDDDISYGELVQMVLGGKHAITETYSYLRNLLAHDDLASGKTYVLKQQIYQGALAFFLPKHTPWRNRLDLGLKRLVEAGLVNKWYTNIMSASDGRIVNEERASGEIALDIFNLQGPFMLLLLGLLVALVTFILEIAVWSSRRGGRNPSPGKSEKISVVHG